MTGVILFRAQPFHNGHLNNGEMCGRPDQPAGEAGSRNTLDEKL